MTADGDDRSSATDHSAGSGTDHYFDDDPDVASDPITIDVSLPDTAFTLRTDRGVFARGQLDTGTSLLLRTPDVPLASHGNLLDLGCGAGPIAMTIARRSPDATVWAIDVNRRALELCRANAVDNGLANVTACLPEEVPPQVRFESILSNPPIRVGKAALHDLLLRWLPRLSVDGTCTLVVQKHLGADSLQRWLTDQGYPTRRLASKVGYRLLGTSTTAGG